MARSSLLDPLRSSNFWLYDVAPIDITPALPLFTPLSGFASITAPEITIETQQINEGNWPFTKSVVKSASVGAITLSRGVAWFNSDFWRWTMAAVQGNTGTTGINLAGVSYRRTLLLVHFFRNTPAPGPFEQIAMAAGLTGALSTVTGFAVAADAGAGLGVAAGAASGAQLGALQAAGSLFSPQTVGIKIPARAFLLKNCIPTRYKSGTDYDASSGQVSIQELDIQPEMVEEISLAG
jgi:phage tail-like protein